VTGLININRHGLAQRLVGATLYQAFFGAVRR
jgi:hypothetical protein